MVTATRTRDDSNENKMLAWAVHLMKMHRYNVTTIDPAAGARPCGRVTALARPESPSRRVAKSPSRRVANFSRVAESRVAAPRLRATRPTLSRTVVVIKLRRTSALQVDASIPSQQEHPSLLCPEKEAPFLSREPWENTEGKFFLFCALMPL